MIKANIYTGTLYQEGEDGDNDDILEAEHKTGVNNNLYLQKITLSEENLLSCFSLQRNVGWHLLNYFVVWEELSYFGLG